jgi:cytochrome c-type biogenesis protein
MEAWLNQVAPQLLKDISIYAYGLVFLAGLVSSIGPCNITMVPIIVAHVAGKEATRRRSFAISMAFMLGTATTFMLLGIFIAVVGGIFGTSRSIIYYLVASVCVIIGLNLLGILRLNINFGGNLLNRTANLSGLGGSYLLGLTMGLVGSQCGTPMLLVILSLALASGKWLYGASLLFVYALGRGVPVVLAGTFTGILSRMQLFAATSQALERVAGLIIILVGGYFFWIVLWV